MHKVDWYFDFVSPYAYLASEGIERVAGPIEWRPRPILFAALLDHWQTLGPAEIPPMRRFTFRFVRYLADRDGIALKLPPRHPFNPLRLLRLCVALGAEPALVKRLFRFVWAEGRGVDDDGAWRDLGDELGVADAERLVAAAEVKARLRANTDEAIERGVFGVPAFVVDDEVFWGYDSLPFLQLYLDDPALLAAPGMRAGDALPEGPGRGQREEPNA